MNMKKSLIALAVAGAFSAPAFAATSNVDIYGVIDASVTNVDVKVAGVKIADNWQVGNVGNDSAVDSSRLGFKGTEDLGGGLKAIWQIESKIDVEGTGTTIGQRNTFLGLAGSFGTVIIGNHDTPEKLSTASLDVFADSVGDYNMMGVIIDTRESDVLAYISPTWSGFHFAVATVAGEGQVKNVGAGKNEGIADHYSMTGIYQNGPLHLSVAYTSLKDGYDLSALKFGGNQFLAATALPDTKIWRLGAGYTMGDLKLTAVYQNVDIDGFAGALEKGYTLGAAYTMGPIVLKAQYGTREDLLEGWSVGADYNMSKRTKAYVVYTAYDNETSGPLSNTDLKALRIGLRHSF